MPVPSAPNRTLLLIEDDPDAVFLFRHAFAKVPETEAWELAHVQDGQEAMKFILERSPDAIVTDLIGIKISGSQLISWIRGHQLLRNVPVFVFSNSERLVDRQACKEAGADEYINKKAMPDELRKTIGRLISLANMVRLDKEAREARAALNG